MIDFTSLDTQRTRRGSPIDVFAAVSSAEPRALSALDMPAVRDPFPVLSVSGDWFAWSQVNGQYSYCDSSDNYPISDMRWAIASTGSAHHYWHIGSNGYGTFLRVETGFKLLYIARPKSGSFEDFATVSIFTEKYVMYEANDDLWDTEVVVLEPGDVL